MVLEGTMIIAMIITVNKIRLSLLAIQTASPGPVGGADARALHHDHVPDRGESFASGTLRGMFPVWEQPGYAGEQKG